LFKGLTKRAQRILTILAQEEAKHFHSTELIPEHVMLAIIRSEEGSGYKLLQSLSLDLLELKLELEKACISKKSGFLLGDAPLSRRLKIMLETAAEEAHFLESEYIGTEHLVLSCAREEDSVFQTYLLKNSISFQKMKMALLGIISSVEEKQVRNVLQNSKYNNSSFKKLFLDDFSIDLTELARNNKLDPVIDRNQELQRIIQILCRRTKNNPILIGEPGVGKTALIEGLAQHIAQKNVPVVLQNKRIIMLDMASIVAGTKYRGEFEERLKKIIKEIIAEKNIILFIDEIHTLIGAGGAEGTIDASNMLKPSLSRGEIQCIGATTIGEYKKYLEKDAALERRFQTVIVEEPGVDATLEILQGIKSYYEEFHHVVYSQESLEIAVKLAKRFLHERSFPDKAIDIIDEAGAAKQLSDPYRDNETMLQNKIAELSAQKLQLVSQQDYEGAALIRDKIKEMKKELAGFTPHEHEFKKTVSDEDIFNAVANMTGIPVSRIQEGESEYLSNLETLLHERIVGQHEAVKAIANAIRRARAGISDENRPFGSFIFLGPTGVGKTLLAKTLAEILFGDNEALIRIDMSDFMEKHTVARLVGAPPGYIGYEEGGLLTEKVRHKPYCIILFDEIEKAHPDVYNLLLQVLEEGELQDNLGHTVSFRNAILIMTSNAGTQEILHGKRLGFGSEEKRFDYEVIKESANKALANFLRPEFINRVDETIVFEPLSKQDIEVIFDLEIQKLQKRLENQKLQLIIDEFAKSYFIEHGYNDAYGARPLRRLIIKEIENKIAVGIITGEYAENTVIQLSCKDDEIIMSVQKISKTEHNKKLSLKH